MSKMSRLDIRICAYVSSVLSLLYPHSGHIIFRIQLQRECHSKSEACRLSDHLSYSEYHLLQDFQAELDYQSYLHLLEELSSPVYHRTDILFKGYKIWLTLNEFMHLFANSNLKRIAIHLCTIFWNALSRLWIACSWSNKLLCLTHTLVR